MTEEQLNLLKKYRELTYINSLLAEQSYNYYVFIKNLVNIPLIIVNSAMVVINATITDEQLLKILNIILNSSTGLILSLISNFKIYESIQSFHQLYIKFNKLNHLIDSKMCNEPDNITPDFINTVISHYDGIIDTIEITFPNHIKKRIKNEYKDIQTLPTSLSVSIVEVCDTNRCCK